MRVHAAPRDVPQRRGFTHIDAEGERTITVIGERIVPHGADPLPWERLDEIDGVYFTGGDPGALRAARRAGRSSRRRAPRRRCWPRASSSTRWSAAAATRASGSTRRGWTRRRATSSRPRAAGAAAGRRPTAPPAAGRRRRCRGRGGTATAPGDSFAAALAYGLGDGRGIDGACALAALAGAHKLTGRAPFENQLELSGA